MKSLEFLYSNAIITETRQESTLEVNKMVEAEVGDVMVVEIHPISLPEAIRPALRIVDIHEPAPVVPESSVIARQVLFENTCQETGLPPMYFGWVALEDDGTPFLAIQLGPYAYSFPILNIISGN